MVVAFKFRSKSKILSKAEIFGEKSKILPNLDETWSNAKSLAKNWNFRQKSKS